MADRPDFDALAKTIGKTRELPDFDAIARSLPPPIDPGPKGEIETFERRQPIANIPARVQMSLVRKADKAAELEKKREILKNTPGFSNAELYFYPPPGGQDNKPGILTYKINKDDPAEKEKLVDSPMEKGTGIGEFVTDMFEFFAADAGAIFGEGIALETRAKALGDLAQKLPGPQQGPLKLLEGVWDASAPVRLGAGAFVGDIAQTELERASGLTDIGRGQQALEATGQAAVATFGGFLVDMLGAPTKAVLGSGEGVFKKKRAGARAQLAQEEMGRPPLPISAVVSNPVMKAVGGQASAMTTGLSEYITMLRTANLETMDRFAKLPFKDKLFPPMDYLERTHAREVTRVKNRVSKFIDRKVRPGQSAPSMTEFGKEVGPMLDEYQKYATSLTNRAYGRARRIAEPVFDDTSLKKTAKKIRTGVRVPQASGTQPTAIVRPGGLATPTSGVQPAGTVTVPGQAVRARAMHSKIADVLDMIDSLDLTQPTAESKTDILRAIRQNLWDLKTPTPGVAASPDMRAIQQDAGSLYGAVTNTLWNVKNTDPKFVGAWRRANSIAANQFRNNEVLLAKIGSKNELPTVLANRLSNLNDPATADTWDMLVRTAGGGPVAFRQTAAEKAKGLPGTTAVLAPHAERLNKVRDAAAASLLSDPRNLTSKLENANPDVLKGVMHQGIKREGLIRTKDLGALRKAGRQFDRLFDLDMQNIAQSQSQLGVAIGKLVNRENTATIDYLYDLMKRNGGEGGKFHRMMSAGILGDILNRAMKDEVEELAEIDPGKMAAIRNRFKVSGADRLLVPEDARMLENVNLSQRMLKELTDAGTSLQRASMVAGLRGIFSSAGRAAAAGLATLAENIGVAAAFRNPQVIKYLTGGKKERTPISDTAQLAGAMTATWLTDAEEAGQLVEDTAKFLAKIPVAIGREAKEFVTGNGEAR